MGCSVIVVECKGFYYFQINLYLYYKIMEIWKDIVWYEWKYQISNLWNVKSLIYNKILKQTKEQNWYLRISLWNGKRWNQTKYSIHRLVSMAFIEKIEWKTDVNHKNWIKDDNRLENLEWVTKSENIRHSIAIWLKAPTKYWKNKKWKDNPRSKKVVQIYDWKIINTFYWISEAWRKLWYDISDISKVCLWRKKHLKWYLFKYI